MTPLHVDLAAASSVLRAADTVGKQTALNERVIAGLSYRALSGDTAAATLRDRLSLETAALWLEHDQLVREHNAMCGVQR